MWVVKIRAFLAFVEERQMVFEVEFVYQVILSVSIERQSSGVH
jgi:hypothetical protein